MSFSSAGLALVAKTVQNLGFASRLETINAIEAWRGSLPGDGYRNVRRVMLHTLNLADVMPITAVWAGLKSNPSPMMKSAGADAAPLLYAATSGATPFPTPTAVGVERPGSRPRLRMEPSSLGPLIILSSPSMEPPSCSMSRNVCT